MAKTATDRVGELRALLHEANRAYYVNASPTMPDAEFDRLLTELASIEAQHPDLADPNSPTQRVGGEPIEGFVTRPHASPMLSIDNTYSEEDLREWHARVLKGLGLEPSDNADALFNDAQTAGPTLVCDPKIDGVAISLRYEHGELVQALTRGDGMQGDDVTANIRTIGSVPLKLGSTAIDAPAVPAIPAILEIRGEVFIPLSEFERINEERKQAGEEPFMNPRNSTAGTLKQLDPKIAASRNLAFLAHGRGEVSDPDFANSHSAFLNRIRSFGASVNTPLASSGSITDIIDAIHSFGSERTTLDHATDGVVVRIDDFALQNQLGATSKSPRWVIAYKYQAERGLTRLIRVDHQVGKSGRITPRAVMEPIVLSGTTVQHATLHNYGFLRKMRTDLDLAEHEDPRTWLREGDMVELEKGGEIIPYVLRVDLSQRPDDAREVAAPERCPECGGPIEIEYDTQRLTEIRRFSSLAKFIERDERWIRDSDSAKTREGAASRLVRDRAALAAGAPVALGPADESGRYCLNPECHSQIREKLIWFAGRRQMDIEGLGEKTIDLIRANAIPLDSFADIFRLGRYREELLALKWREPTKKAKGKPGKRLPPIKLVDGLLGGIEEAKSRGLAQVLVGLGIRHVGHTSARNLARRYPDIDALLAASIEDLMPKVERRKDALFEQDDEPGARGQETGLGKETAPSVHAYLHSAVGQGTLGELKSLGVDLTSRDFDDGSEVVDSPLRDATVVVTGTFGEIGDRDRVKSLCEKLGAKVTGSVSAKTRFVVVGSSPGSNKVSAAKTHGTEMMDEEGLLRVLRENGIEV